MATRLVTLSSDHVPDDKRSPEAILGLKPKDGQWGAVVNISPAAAAELLTHMKRQRPLRKGTVAKEAAAMKSGRWQLTHQGIAFDSEGNLMDGQHRLRGVVEAGEVVELFAVFNVAAKAFDAIDRGLRRQVADDLIIGGEISDYPQAKTVGAAAKLIFHYEGGRAPWSPGAAMADRELILFEAKETRAVLDKHPDLPFACRFALDAGPLLPAAAFAMLYCLTREIDQKLADTFASKVVMGENLRRGDPAYALRETLMGPRGKQYRQDFIVRYIYAWNATREGRELVLVRGASIVAKGSFPRLK